MSIFDNPKIDLYSEASEESIYETRRYFSQRNNFLTREENPDKGVDLDVELLTVNVTTGFKFAIQVKSVQNIEISKIGVSEYIKYQFKTSRLGYLCRRSPGFGIIVLYDDSNKILYYDYVENILEHINRFKDNDDWKDQEKTTIYINKDNILDDSTITPIYSKMYDRYQSFQLLYNQEAKEYDLPVFEFENIHNPSDILDKFGYVFFNRREYRTLYSILQQLKFNKIVNNPKILLLAALTYSEIGLFIDANYFYKKCISYENKYSNNELELLRYVELSTQYHLGDIKNNAYYAELIKLKSLTSDKSNLILIRLRILIIDIVKSFIEGNPELDIIKELTIIIDELGNIDGSEDIKKYYLLEVASCLHEFGILKFINEITTLKIRRKLFGELPLSERLLKAKLLLPLLTIPTIIANQVYDFALKNDITYLKAVALDKISMFFCSTVMHNLFLSLENRSDLENFKRTQREDMFLNYLNCEILSFNIFSDQMNFINAYKVLTRVIELNYLYSFIFARTIDESTINSIKNHLGILENQLGEEPYECIAEKAITTLLIEKDNFDELTHDQLDKYAYYFIKYLGLSRDRVENVIYDLHFLKDAGEKVDKKYFDILQNLEHTKSLDTMYKEKPIYVIRCKKCLYSTRESSDLYSLLSQLNVEHGYTCL